MGLGLATWALPAQHDPDCALRTVARDVFVLTDTWRDDCADGELDLAHQFLQLPLEHLGMVCRIHDLRHGEPPDPDADTTRGIVVCLHRTAPAPEWVMPWLLRQRQRGIVRFVHFDNLEPLAARDPGPLRRWLLGFGLSFDERHVADPRRVHVEFADPTRCCLEGPPLLLREHHGPRSVDARNTVWTTTIDRDRPDDARHPVVTGPWGGIALAPYAVTLGTGAGDRRWHVDPFVFFRDALGLRGVPAFDPCVDSGRRRFLLHVDGDGFESVSTARAGGDLCGAVFHDEIVQRYPLPMTLSVIVASITDDHTDPRPGTAIELARRALSVPWVEAASHSVLHPMNWRRQLHARSLPRSVVWYHELPGYQHDMVAEVSDSVSFVERWLLPPGKRCAVMLWSGEANPETRVLAKCAELGIANVNGGIYRWDAQHDSVGYVAPWGRFQGGHLQVYCGAANENVFDGFFDHLPSAFRHIDQTIANTGRGRILKPANVYAHFYSAENLPRLRALQWLIDKWALQQETIPGTASAWAAAVVGAREGRIVGDGQRYHFAGSGGCRTVRFDDERRGIDWPRCTGIAGARRLHGALYVQLATENAELALADDGIPWPHVEQASVALHDVAIGADRIAFGWQCFAPGTVVLQGVAADAVVQVRLDGETQFATRPADGRVVLALPAGAHRAEVWCR